MNSTASFVFVFALLLTPQLAEGSIIVILASPTGILVGADSRRTTDGAVFHDACKIRAGARGAFAATGSYPDALLERIWSAGEELADSTNTAAANLDALVAIINAEPVAQEAVHQGSLAFVSWSPGGPMAASARFTTKDGRYHFERSIKDWRMRPGFVAGQVILSNVAPSFDEQDLLEFAKNPKSFEVIERVIRLQAGRDPTVGGPTDLLRIDPHGVRWYRQKPECRDARGLQSFRQPAAR